MCGYKLVPQEDFVKYEKPRLQDVPVNAKVLKDLEKLLVLLQKI